MRTRRVAAGAVLHLVLGLATATMLAFAAPHGVSSSSAPKLGGHDPYEPNDAFAQAYGPLTSGVIYDALMGTTSDYDYWYVDVAEPGLLELFLSEQIPEARYKLTLYNNRAEKVTEFDTGDDVGRLIRHVYPQRFYLLVRSIMGHSETRPYHLQVFVPGQPPICGTTRRRHHVRAE